MSKVQTIDAPGNTLRNYLPAAPVGGGILGSPIMPGEPAGQPAAGGTVAQAGSPIVRTGAPV